MRVIRRSQRSSDATGLSLALGNFDGVHLGHQALLNAAVQTANQHNLIPAALTFAPHPRAFFTPKCAPFFITSLRQKTALLETYQIQQTILHPFDMAVATQSAEDFIHQMLHRNLHTKHVVIGDDFTFGAGRKGNAELMHQVTHSLGITCEIIPAITRNQTRISSTHIRELLSHGDITVAEAMLGHSYAIEGRVIHGRKLAHTLGFPTANIRLKQYHSPRYGVYIVSSVLDGKIHYGVANIGIKPTLHSTPPIPLLEVHFFHLDANLYGQRLAIRLHHFLRDERLFPSLEALKMQIHTDATQAQQWVTQYA